MELPRKARGKIADIDHLLHFAFAFRGIFPVSSVTSRPRSAWRRATPLPSWRMISPRLGARNIPPFLKRRRRAANGLFVLRGRSLTDCGKNFAVDREMPLENPAAAKPFHRRKCRMTAFRPNFFSKAVVDTPGFGLERDFMLDDL